MKHKELIIINYNYYFITVVSISETVLQVVQQLTMDHLMEISMMYLM